MKQELRIKNKKFSLWTIIHNSLFIIRKSEGFTLVEMTLYMALLSILIVIMVEIFASSLDVQLESQSTSSVQQDGRYILSKLIYDVGSAQSISMPATVGDTSNSLQIAVNSINYTYALNNGNLELTNNNGTDFLNSYDTTISNVSFQKIGNNDGKNSVKILFRVTSKTQRTAGAESKSFQTTIGLR